jgi:hypothetical protein
MQTPCMVRPPAWGHDLMICASAQEWLEDARSLGSSELVKLVTSDASVIFTGRTQVCEHREDAAVVVVVGR